MNGTGIVVNLKTWGSSYMPSSPHPQIYLISHYILGLHLLSFTIFFFIPAAIALVQPLLISHGDYFINLTDLASLYCLGIFWLQVTENSTKWTFIT